MSAHCTQCGKPLQEGARFCAACGAPAVAAAIPPERVANTTKAGKVVESAASELAASWAPPPWPAAGVAPPPPPNGGIGDALGRVAASKLGAALRQSAPPQSRGSSTAQPAQGAVKPRGGNSARRWLVAVAGVVGAGAVAVLGIAARGVISGLISGAMPSPAAPSASLPAVTPPTESPASNSPDAPAPPDGSPSTTTTPSTAPSQATPAPPDATPAPPPAGASETSQQYQPQQADASGRVIVEAATIHHLTCDNGQSIYVYEYADRTAFRAIQPPNWSSALGGRDFSSLADATATGCAQAQ
jgi:hypothetical protein